MTPEAYLKKLQSHDWYYNYSDDNRVYNAGLAEERDLRAIARTDPELEQLFESYLAFVFSGPTFGIPKQPAPTINTASVA